MVPPKPASADRRCEHRHSFACEVEPLSAPPRRADGGDGESHCVVVNVSARGVCILTNCTVEAFAVVPCKFQFPCVPVHVPVLAQVRWIEPAAAEGEPVRVGLSFLA